MGESNCHDSRMAAYWQEVRKLEEMFNGFKLHHILRQDNTSIDALVRLGSSREPTPPGVFAHDLFKFSIRLEEDVLVCSPGTSPNKGTLVPIPKTPPRENSPTSTSGANPGASAGPIAPSPGPEGEVAAVVGPPCLEVDWQRPITKYLRLGTIPDNETKTRHLARRVKGYLIHDDELYRCSASGILQRCIPLRR
jgi:hypothetical protein